MAFPRLKDCITLLAQAASMHRGVVTSDRSFQLMIRDNRARDRIF